MAELISNTELLEELKPVDAVENIQVSVDASDAYEKGKIDINFFAGLALPNVCIYALPYFYLMVFQLLIKRDAKDIGKVLRFALGLPRGHAKTTFIKILICWLIAYDRSKFVLIVCATEPNAKNLLKDISSIMSSRNMEAVYGKWFDNLSVDNTNTKQSSYHNEIVTVMAIGSETSIRGLNLENSRPDLILFDDFQTRKNDESPVDSAKLFAEFVATFIKLIDTEGNRLIIYIGNMYSENCILKKLQDSPYWISLITGAILEDGMPLWPELFSLETLMESFLHDEQLGQADVWFAEVMNDPKNTKTSLLHKQLEGHPYGEFEPDGVFLTIDPAGYRKESDDNVIVGHGVYDGVGFIMKTIAGNMNPQELIRDALKMALELGASVIGVESVAYQQTLKFWIEFFMDKLQLKGITVVELKPHGRSKESRIREFITELYAGTYYHYNTEERAIFAWQANKYKIGKKDNKDDLLDAEAYGLDIRKEYWHLITNLKKNLENGSKAFVVEDNAPF